MMPRLLFDDIPYLPIAQQEHDNFADTLRQNQVEVLYLEKLVVEALDAGGETVKADFLTQMLAESGYVAGVLHTVLKDYLNSMTTEEMVVKLMAGVRKK